MTRQNNRGRKISRETFSQIKAGLKVDSVAVIAKEFGIGETTVRRIKKSRSYSEYKGYIAASNGSKQFNEDEFQEKLDKITAKPRHESYHHYVDQPQPVEDDLDKWGVVFIIGTIVVAILFIGAILWAAMSFIMR